MWDFLFPKSKQPPTSRRRRRTKVPAIFGLKQIQVMGVAHQVVLDKNTLKPQLANQQLLLPLKPLKSKDLKVMLNSLFAAKLKQRAWELAEETGLRPQRLFVRVQKTRWGTCSSRGNISINLLLAFAPPAVLDYVIYHELAHLQHLDHSRNFWNLLESLQPNYRDHKAWLKKEGMNLHQLLGI